MSKANKDGATQNQTQKCKEVSPFSEKCTSVKGTTYELSITDILVKLSTQKNFSKLKINL